MVVWWPGGVGKDASPTGSGIPFDFFGEFHARYDVVCTEANFFITGPAIGTLAFPMHWLI